MLVSVFVVFYSCEQELENAVENQKVQSHLSAQNCQDQMNKAAANLPIDELYLKGKFSLVTYDYEKSTVSQSHSEMEFITEDGNHYKIVNTQDLQDTFQADIIQVLKVQKVSENICKVRNSPKNELRMELS